MILTLPFLMNSSYARMNNHLIPLSRIDENLYKEHFYKALESSELLIHASKYEFVELERIGLRVGVSLEVGIGPFSIEGETQHRFIYSLQ